MKLRVNVAKDYIVEINNPIFDKLEKELELEKSGKKVEKGLIEEAVEAIKELTGLPDCSGNCDFEPEQEYIVAVWNEDTTEVLFES